MWRYFLQLMVSYSVIVLALVSGALTGGAHYCIEPIDRSGGSTSGVDEGIPTDYNEWTFFSCLNLQNLPGHQVTVSSSPIPVGLQ